MSEEELERQGLLAGVDSPEEREARITLLEELMQAGVPVEDLKTAVDDDRLALLPLERVFTKEAKYTFRELAERAGVTEDFLRRDLMALGLSEPGPEEVAFSDENVEGIKGLRALLDIGVPEDDVLQLARVAGQSSARLAEATMRVLGNVLIKAGDTERDLGLRYADVAMKLMPMTPHLAGNSLRLHIREAIRREVVGRAERAAGLLPGSRDIAVCFADLVGFTRLGERLPMTEIGTLAERLEDMASTAARPPVRLVKMIGDAAMLVSTDVRSSVEAALDLVSQADAQTDFPRIRAGLAHGPAIGRMGDWYGRPVNLASRITSAARPGSVLVTEDIKSAAGDGYRWSRAPTRRFKGIEGQVRLYRVRHPRLGRRTG